MVTSLMWAALAVAGPPDAAEISNGFRSAPPPEVPALVGVPLVPGGRDHPDAQHRAVFLVDPGVVAEVLEAMADAGKMPADTARGLTTLGEWPVTGGVDGALLLVNATHDPVGRWRLLGGTPQVRIDGQDLESTLR